MTGKIKRQVVALVLAVLVLAAMITPVLAIEDVGEGQGEFFPSYMTEKYPAGMLAAEGWE